MCVTVFGMESVFSLTNGQLLARCGGMGKGGNRQLQEPAQAIIPRSAVVLSRLQCLFSTINHNQNFEREINAVHKGPLLYHYKNTTEERSED
jgi:hypothetical protein